MQFNKLISKFCSIFCITDTQMYILNAFSFLGLVSTQSRQSVHNTKSNTERWTTKTLLTIIMIIAIVYSWQSSIMTMQVIILSWLCRRKSPITTIYATLDDHDYRSGQQLPIMTIDPGDNCRSWLSIRATIADNDYRSGRQLPIMTFDPGDNCRSWLSIRSTIADYYNVGRRSWKYLQ